MVWPAARERHRLESLVGPAGYWDRLQMYQIGFLRRMGLKPDHSLLDIGCGPLQGGLAFIRYLRPTRYVGIDLREEAIKAGYLQIAKENLVAKNPFLIVSDNFGKTELGDREFDYFWASQVMYSMDEGQIDALLEQIAARMKPDSTFYGDILSSTIELRRDARNVSTLLGHSPSEFSVEFDPFFVALGWVDPDLLGRGEGFGLAAGEAPGVPFVGGQQGALSGVEDFGGAL